MVNERRSVLIADVIFILVFVLYLPTVFLVLGYLLKDGIFLAGGLYLLASGAVAVSVSIYVSGDVLFTPDVFFLAYAASLMMFLLFLGVLATGLTALWG